MLRPLPFLAFLVSAVSILALMPARPASAQDGDRVLRPGAKALQFQIGPDFTLNSFDGATLAWKWHGSATRAWRVGVDLRSLAASNERETLYRDSLFSSRISQEQDLGIHGLGLTLQRLFYAQPRTAVLLYLGAGPSVGFQRDHAEESNPLETIETTSTSWDAGLDGSLGVEWLFTRELSLLAEYRVFAGFVDRRLERERRGGDGARVDEEIDSSSWSLGSNGVRFGLSAYWR